MTGDDHAEFYVFSSRAHSRSVSLALSLSWNLNLCERKIRFDVPLPFKTQIGGDLMENYS